MKKIITALFGVIIAVHCFSRSVVYYEEIDPQTEQMWTTTINHLLRNYYPFKTEVIGQDFNRIKEENEPLPKTLKMFFILGTDYQKELSTDPSITNVNYQAQFRITTDISMFELQPVHTNLNCYELFELVAKETTNTFSYRYDPTLGRIRYEIRANQQVEPSVKTPVESGNEQVIKVSSYISITEASEDVVITLDNAKVNFEKYPLTLKPTDDIQDAFVSLRGATSMRLFPPYKAVDYKEFFWYSGFNLEGGDDGSFKSGVAFKKDTGEVFHWTTK